MNASRGLVGIGLEICWRGSPIHIPISHKVKGALSRHFRKQRTTSWITVRWFLVSQAVCTSLFIMYLGHVSLF